MSADRRESRRPSERGRAGRRLSSFACAQGPIAHLEYDRSLNDAKK
jgi:hypothetical protein